jgi:uncharacterized protein (TIGR01777 family)
MKIFITGGTGFVGTTLTRVLREKGHELTLLKRPGESPRTIPAQVTVVDADPTVPGPWQARAAEADAVINLAGASIFSRWNEAMKKTLRDSRILTTRNLVQAMAGGGGRSTTLLSTSAVGYYGFHEDERLTETDPAGTDFLATLAADWEAEALAARNAGVRVLTLRFGIVLGRHGGALGQMLPLFRFGLGSPLGTGRQWFSWIHEADLARIYLHLLERTDLEGPVNCTAPEPVQNRVFTAVLGKVLGRPTFLPPVPGFMMRLVLGEFGDVLLKGQRVVPLKLLQSGFPFHYPTVEEALRDLTDRRR